MESNSIPSSENVSVIKCTVKEMDLAKHFRPKI